MPTKTGAGGAQQEYDESTGRYGGGHTQGELSGKGTEFRQNTGYSDLLKDTAPAADLGLQAYQTPKEKIIRRPEDAEKWAKYDDDYRRYKAAEPNITKDVDEISAQTGLPLIGRDWRLKGEKSYERKVNDKRINGPYKPLGDVVRYTFEHKVQNAPEDIKKTLDKFKEKGYNIVAVDNRWKDSGSYNGINCDLVSPDGIPIEVQFHTLRNSKIKELNHKYYEIARDSRTPVNIRLAAEKKMQEFEKLWEIPDRIKEV